MKRVLRNQIGKIVSILELTKERILICKKIERFYVCVLEKRIRVLEKMEFKKWLSLIRVIDLRHKMSIYMLKLGFLDILMIFGRYQGSMGRPTSKHYVLGP